MDTHHLTDEERARLGLQADMLIRLIADRYSVTPNQVVDAVRWIEQHREFVSKLKNGGWFTLMGMIITGMALALWEGIKHFASAGGKSG